jgi:hypothetical protein
MTPENPFAVGAGVTFNIGSDSYPATVVDVSPSGHRVTITRDRMTPNEGVNGIAHRWTEADATFTVDPDARRQVFTRRATKTGFAWVEKGSKYVYLSPGRSCYMDPSF